MKGYFTTIFASKLIKSFFNLLRQNAVDMQNRSTTDTVSQVVQRARPGSGNILLLGLQMVKTLSVLILYREGIIN